MGSLAAVVAVFETRLGTLSGRVFAWSRLPRPPRGAGALAALGTAALLASPAWAASRWSAEARLGGAWNLPLPLAVRQEGHPELRFRARWGTRPFELPLYYAARATSWRGERGWAVELLHHKIHLENPPPEIQGFGVSHGYNLLTLQRLVPAGPAMAGLLAGVVVAHPESRVRGEALDESGGLLESGYYVAGPTLGASLGTPPPARGGPYLVAEARLTLSWARVPVARGEATVPNVSLHAGAGLGWHSR